VAHGKNSGTLFAKNFSNKNESNKSSLGFYITGNTYRGKHGESLKLTGMENGINDKAAQRAIVLHGANYVSNNNKKMDLKGGISLFRKTTISEFLDKQGVIPEQKLELSKRMGHSPFVQGTVYYHKTNTNNGI
jgi:hypothetical protein